MNLQTGILPNVDGSAELEDTNSKVIVSVSGPIEPKIKQELPNMACLEIVIRPSLGVPTTRENLLADKVRSILSSLIIRYKYPRQLIQIVVQVLKKDTDGVIINNHRDTYDNLNVFNSEFSNIINCCYFALLDGNIGLYQSFIAVNQGILDNKILVNPSLTELIGCKSTHVLVLSVADDKPQKLVYIESSGEFTEKQLLSVVDKAYDTVGEKFQQFKALIENKLERDFIWKS